ncbi:MAG TPA: T9SS type A sorting domain-containing protein [bacterium]
MRLSIRWFVLLIIVCSFNNKVSASTYNFQPALSLSTNVSPRGVAVGNVYGDVFQSLVVANFGSSTFIGQTTPATLLSALTPTLQVFSPSARGLQLTNTISTASSPRGVFLFDLGNKNYQDILVTAYDSNLLQVFSWDKGQFLKTSEQATLKMPVGVNAGLTRAGGNVFVAVADYGDNKISLFQVEGGKLGKRFDIPVDDGPTQVAIGDLNGDGKNDIAVACLSANKVDLLSMNPTGSNDDLSSYAVTKTITLPGLSAPSDLRVADLNSDGKMDLVVSCFATNTINLYFQKNDGSLSAQPVLSTSGLHPNGLDVADLNGDGGKEIVIANRDSDSLDIFQFVGGQYQLVQTLKVAEDSNSGFGPVEIRALDSRKLGKMDLVTSQMRSNTIKVLNQVVAVSTPTPVSTAAPSSNTDQPFSDKTTMAYPNPSHDGKVKLSFTLESPSPIIIRIFDLSGRLVWNQTLSASQTNSGVNTVDWSGINQSGENLASGLYLCSITVGNQTITKKIAIIH